jgi:hypothetical protein
MDLMKSSNVKAQSSSEKHKFQMPKLKFNILSFVFWNLAFACLPCLPQAGAGMDFEICHFINISLREPL